MTAKFSAYLSIFNDWDILPAALHSVAPHINELVVVDGAYDWMVPYLTRLGRDPKRSDPKVYAAIEESGIPFRIISKTWKNEIQKRQTGYEACTHDYIYRVDADEIIFFNDQILEAALSDGLAVGEMEMPNYVAPGWISRAKDIPNIERQCFLFDRRQISSQIHLNYLWLILTADVLPMAGRKPFPVHQKSLAFNAHLTAWRTPATGVNRAAFYTLNWMRHNGVPWLPEFRDKPLANMEAFFDVVPPLVFQSSLQRGRTACGMIETPGERTFVPTTLSDDQEATFSDIYGTFLASLADMNRRAAEADQTFLTTFPTLFDLSTPAARSAIAPRGVVSLRMSAPLLSAKSQLLSYVVDQSANNEQMLPVTIDGSDLHIELPEPRFGESGFLRQCLELHVWPNSPELSQQFRALS